ncbi:LOW QUALITY PROTEIN: monocarboxylate transporter 4-like [Pomacea canaliculata]|uniref:LOW QUALITY PROTEIN: monocarboxylate transporter 4-like n=1 Tax=Pomacea canaliculata TaxID=400727 RepID=UPI000D732EA2|nr:LOW QUALITY PROTEIN: monocarboxylate transporter 4-like [Pomacea canaliculata]
MLSMGPLAGAVCSRFSARASVMVGAVLYTAGLVFSGLAPNMPTLLFFFGVVQGLGRGLAYAPGLILVGMYFNRLRGVAVGLSTAGVGAGTFLLPPVVEMLFETYGFFGAFFILGGIALHFFVVAFLYRPLFLHRKIVLTGRRCQTEALLENEKRRDVAELPQTVYDKSEHNTVNPSLLEMHLTHLPQQESFLVTPAASVPGESMMDDTVCVSSVSSHKSHLLKSFLRTCFPVEKQATGSKRRKLMHWSLLKQPAFVLYCLSMCLLTASMKSSIVFLPPLAKSRGVSETNAAYLLSISGVADTVGRVLTGVVLELSIVRPYRPMAFSSFLFAIGALAFASPFCLPFHTSPSLSPSSAFSLAHARLKSVILVDLLGQETLSSSFGIMSFFQGVGNFVGPPLSGVLKDVFDQYDEAFYLGGGAMTVAGIFMVISNVYTVSHRPGRELFDICPNKSDSSLKQGNPNKKLSTVHLIKKKKMPTLLQMPDVLKTTIKIHSIEKSPQVPKLSLDKAQIVSCKFL